MRNAQARSKSRPLSREDWIEAATQLLVKKSVDSIRVEPLAELMQVTRGSFYWHFKSRADLLEAILSTWHARQTTRIVERLGADDSLSPFERLVRLRSMPPKTKRSRDAAALELAIRAWARRDKFAKRVVEEVDRERVAFVCRLLVDAGMPADSAQTWACLGYAYSIGESILREGWGEDRIMACRKLLMQAQFPHQTTD